MRPTIIVLIIGFSAFTGCAPPETEVIGQIGSKDAKYVVHRSGGTVDDFLTIDVKDGVNSKSILSISGCSVIGARHSPNKIEIIVFDPTIAVGQSSEESIPNFQTLVTAYERDATEDDLTILSKSRFSLIICSDYL